MEREKAVCVLICIAVPILLGMGALGDPPPRERAPEPRDRLDAVVVDMEGITIQVTHLSYDGELYLPVYRGRALITIPFRNIQKMEFGAKERSRREVRITLRDESSQVFSVDEDILFLGKVPYGTFQIMAKDIRQLEFTDNSSE